MAKKVVASLQKKGGKSMAKVLKLIQSKKTGAYCYKEEIVFSDKVNTYFQE